MIVGQQAGTAPYNLQTAATVFAGLIFPELRLRLVTYVKAALRVLLAVILAHHRLGIPKASQSEELVVLATVLFQHRLSLVAHLDPVVGVMSALIALSTSAGLPKISQSGQTVA